MIAYVDSSVVLRLLLGQEGALDEWPQVERGIGSELVEVECLRAVDRLTHAGALGSEPAVDLRRAIYRVVGSLEVVGLTRAVLSRAAQPLPAPLGTLDALHLATALLWGETTDLRPVLLTHDAALGRAAEASGLETLGC